MYWSYHIAIILFLCKFQSWADPPPPPPLPPSPALFVSLMLSLGSWFCNSHLNGCFSRTSFRLCTLGRNYTQVILCSEDITWGLWCWFDQLLVNMTQVAKDQSHFCEVKLEELLVKSVKREKAWIYLFFWEYTSFSSKMLVSLVQAPSGQWVGS